MERSQVMSALSPVRMGVREKLGSFMGRGLAEEKARRVEMKRRCCNDERIVAIGFLSRV